MTVAPLFWLTVQVAMFSLVGAAIFLLVRRRGPSAAAACAATVLIFTLPLLLVSLSPWPRWQIAAKREATTENVPPVNVATGSNLESDALTTFEMADVPAEDVSQESAIAVLWRKAGELLDTPAQPAESAVETPPPVWRTWLPWMMAAGVAFGLARLLVGIWVVRSYRGCSTPVNDEELLQLVRNVEQKLNAPSVLLTLRREESSETESALQQDPSQNQNPAARSITAERDEYTGPLSLWEMVMVRVRVPLLRLFTYSNSKSLHPHPGLLPAGASELRIEIRETPRLRSAATIGWRRPILLLPADWRTWTTTERRVVIAHELAHVARRDYLMVVIARLATAIHFYQPLVLWLARQLRVQQELAADAWAADITGSRQTYLTTLAQMALRADDQTIPWAARAFLPGTGLLVKRVTWLKRNSSQEERTMKRRSRWVLTVAMAAVALFVAGIRGPNEPAATVKAAEPATEKPKQSVAQNAQPSDFIGTINSNFAQAAGQNPADGGEYTLGITKHRTTEFIPADAKMVVGICPKQLSQFPQLAKFFEFLDKQDFEELFGIPLHELDDIVQVKMVAGGSLDRTVFRAAKPHDWKKLLGTRLIPDPKAVQAGDKTYYLAGEQARLDLGRCAYFPDDRTLVMASEEEMKKIVSGADKKPDTQLEMSITTARAFVWAEMEFLKATFKLERLKADPFTAAILPVFDKVKTVTLSADISTQAVEPRESVYLSLVADCGTAEAAQEVAKTADAVRTLSLNVVEMEGKRYATILEQPADVRPQMIQLTATLWKLGAEILKNTRIKPSDRIALAESRFPLPPEIVTAIVLPSVGAAREAAMRSQSMNNLKQLALAMHNYADAKKRFPPPVVVRRDSKTKLSWRVAILPYIGEADLYDQYHFDEPWDSENNRKLINKMPAVFRDPHAPKDSTSSSYYMVTGKGTFGDSESGRRIKEFTDGLLNTIMLVDAKRDIPWTKPEDIEIDADPAKPLPKFGGFLQPEGFFAAALADGSVWTFATGIDPKSLRALFSVGGGEDVSAEAIFRQPAEQKPLPGAAIQPAKDAAAMTQRINNAKQIMLAMLNHHSAKKLLPPAASRDANGKPLLSWRVAVLPFIEGGRELHAQFRLDEPWDSEHNRKLIANMPAVFRDPVDDPKSTNASFSWSQARERLATRKKGGG